MADETFRTFKRSANNFEEFARAEKIEVDTDLTREQARERCDAFNNNRTASEIEAGTKLEFEQE
jgi:hypothetical protein